MAIGDVLGGVMGVGVVSRVVLEHLLYLDAGKLGKTARRFIGVAATILDVGLTVGGLQGREKRTFGT